MSLRAVVSAFLLAGALSFAAYLQSEGWRGIRPLRTTRAEVERLLGLPPGEHGYEFEAERAEIRYSGEPCTPGMEGGFMVPPETVVSIAVTPTKRLLLSDLRLDPRKYERFAPPRGEVVASYVNSEEGVTYSVVEGGGEGDGRVLRIFYGPAAGDIGLRCTAPAEGPPCRRPPHMCPDADIQPTAGDCRGPEHKLVGSISNADPEDTFTFKWAVSAGAITSGQGTQDITVDSSTAGGRPIRVTLTAVSSLCEACPIEATYRIEPCTEGEGQREGERRPATPPGL